MEIALPLALRMLSVEPRFTADAVPVSAANVMLLLVKATSPAVTVKSAPNLATPFCDEVASAMVPV